MIIIKKVFTDNLPRKHKKKVVIDWKNCVGKYVHFIYDNIEGNILIKQVLPKQKLLISFNNKEICITQCNFIKCQLGLLLDMYKEGSYKYEIGYIENDIEITGQTKDNRNKKAYKIKCHKCGFDSNMEYYLNSKKKQDYLKSEYGNIFNCPCCGTGGKIVVKGINDIATVRPDLVKYFVNIEDAYTHSIGSQDKVLVKCPICKNEQYITPHNLGRQGFSCSKCSDKISFPNKFLNSFCQQLKELKLIKEFKTEKEFKWSNNRKYDFYITLNNSKTLIIEAHGEQHCTNSFKNSKRTLQEEQRNDAEKCWLAYKNGIDNYIQLDCRKSDLNFIKNNILNNKLLNTLFNFKEINWDKCREFAEKNILKEVCDYWNKKGDFITTGKVSKNFGLSKTTIIKYLKIGNEIGLCNYNPKKQNKKPRK